MFAGNILEYNPILNLEIKTSNGIDLSLNNVNKINSFYG